MSTSYRKPPTATARDQRVGPHLARRRPRGGQLVLDDVERLPRGVLAGGRADPLAQLLLGVEAIAQRVWGTIRIRSTPSRCTPSTSASRAAAVTRPPGLRKILASPGLQPEHPQRVDAGVHAGHDRDAGVGDAVRAAEVEVGGELPVGGDQVIEVEPRRTRGRSRTTARLRDHEARSICGGGCRRASRTGARLTAQARRRGTYWNEAVKPGPRARPVDDVVAQSVGDELGLRSQLTCYGIPKTWLCCLLVCAVYAVKIGLGIGGCAGDEPVHRAPTRCRQVMPAQAHGH